MGDAIAEFSRTLSFTRGLSTASTNVSHRLITGCKVGPMWQSILTDLTVLRELQFLPARR